MEANGSKYSQTLLGHREVVYVQCYFPVAWVSLEGMVNMFKILGAKKCKSFMVYEFFGEQKNGLEVISWYFLVVDC